MAERREFHVNTRGRRLRDRLFSGLLLVLALAACVPLFLILFQLIKLGIGQISFSFFTESTPSTLEAMIAKGAGQKIPGGIANGIIGTLLMVLSAAIVAIPLGIFIGVFLLENPRSRYASVVRTLVDTLQATPSIVVGIVIYEWMVVPMGTFSGIAGSAALCLMMVPLIVRSTEESLSLLPGTIKEAGLALGAPYSRVIMRVVLPSAFGGISTGAILAIARTMGETAPLIMTALGSMMISIDMMRPMASVPLLIWEFYNDPNLMEMVWSSSLFLLLLTLFLNVTARILANRYGVKRH